MHTLRLQTIYWLAGLVMALGCLVLGGMVALDNVERYQRYDRGAAQFTRMHGALVLVSRISAERGAVTHSLFGQPSGEGGSAGALTTARTLSDQAAAALIAVLGKDDPSGGELIDMARQVQRHLDEGRKLIDAFSTGQDRAPALAQQAAARMFLASDLAATLRDRIGRAIIDDVPQLGTEIVLSSISSDLREQAGRVRTHLNMMLSFPPELRHATDRQLAVTEGRMEELHSLLQGYSDTYQGLPAIQAALSLMHSDYFGRVLPYARQVRQASLAPGGTVPSSADFNRHYLPGMTPLETLRQLIFQTAEQRVHDARDQAARMLIVAASITLLICAVLVFIGLALHRLLFRPLVTATEQIAAIAHGDLSTPTAIRRSMSPELQGAFQGLQTLRENQRRRQAVERDHQRMAHQLQSLSETDALSGMVNRRGLETMALSLIAEADAQGKRLGLIVFDVDHFKLINDTYGHGAGDQVIRRIGQTLHPMLRARDILARFGGEEFVVLIPNTSEHELGLIAERLRKTLAVLPICTDNPSLTITASFGTAVREPKTLSWHAFFMLADKRLYQAKRMGRNRVCGQDASVPAPERDDPLAPDTGKASA